MASIDLNLLAVPNGTTVKAYAASNWPGPGEPSGAPVGPEAASKKKEGGVVAFTGLNEDTAYWAYAEIGGVHRYFGFRIAKTKAEKEVADEAAAVQSAITAAIDTSADLDGAAASDAKAPSQKAARAAIARVAPYGPAQYGFKAMTTNDPAVAGQTVTPEAGKPLFNELQLPDPSVHDLTKVRFATAQPGSGVTPLANCFLGVVNAAGDLLGKVDITETLKAAAGEKEVTVVAEAGKSLEVQGGPDVKVYIVILVGTQATTPVQFRAIAATSANPNFGRAANGKTLRVGTIGAAKAALVANYVLAEMATAQGPLLIGVK